MRPRQDITNLFSSFVQFDADRFWDWLVDPHLRRRMQQAAQQATQQASENFWALYWHKLWHQGDRLAQSHLVAYVQEPCYWAAQKTAAGFVNSQYTLADCFQMAIARFDKVLKGFNPSQGFNLKSYASATFASLIRESLRQRQEVDICTDWGLLRKLSQKRLVESLHHAGLAPDATHRYICAWSCFKTLYLPIQATATRKLPPPDRATWEAIAAQYHRDRPSPAEPTVTPETIEKWLLACAKAARAYLYPSLISINTPKPGQDGGEFLDDLPQATQTSLLSELIAEEEAQIRQSQQSQVGAVLSEALTNLDAEAKTILQMYYEQELTQQQMAAQLQTKQYTVSRRLTKAREALLLVLAKWSQDTLHITPTPDVLKVTSLALEEWLKTHFSPSEPIPAITPVE
jgi:RNA polymerase sigma factor (sigma-70 family)